MKRRLIIVFIAFLALPFLMTSCKKDEDPKDQITYNGETFELSKGYI
ncbi:MAG: hypothetical protein H6Q27_1096, partial [Ignavibacteriaceae bacterium]|nr:hypothetical protein [Ignavibacteriaceae bacterium]